MLSTFGLHLGDAMPSFAARLRVWLAGWYPEARLCFLLGVPWSPAPDCAYWVQLGPNVAVAANARIGAGVRLISCIILDDVEIKVRPLISRPAASQCSRVSGMLPRSHS